MAFYSNLSWTPGWYHKARTFVRLGIMRNSPVCHWFYTNITNSFSGWYANDRNLFFLILVCEIMALIAPRVIRFSRMHKKRRPLFRFANPFFTYGSAALRVISPCFLDSKHFFRLRMLLNRATKRSDQTKRYYWLHQFPHMPVTKKPQGSRMGKGKGARCAWRAFLNPGNFFIETKYLRPGRSRYFFKQVSRRLPFSYIPAFKYPKRVIIPHMKDRPVRAKYVRL